MENNFEQNNNQSTGPDNDTAPTTDMKNMETDTAVEKDTVSQPQEDKKSVGSIIGIIIIIVIIIIGGLYYWGSYLNKQDLASLTPEEIASQDDTAVEQLQEQGTSDEIADIEADLNATDLEGLDAELEQIEMELNF